MEEAHGMIVEAQEVIKTIVSEESKEEKKARRGKGHIAVKWNWCGKKGCRCYRLGLKHGSYLYLVKYGIQKRTNKKGLVWEYLGIGGEAAQAGLKTKMSSGKIALDKENLSHYLIEIKQKVLCHICEEVDAIAKRGKKQYCENCLTKYLSSRLCAICEGQDATLEWKQLNICQNCFTELNSTSCDNTIIQKVSKLLA